MMTRTELQSNNRGIDNVTAYDGKTIRMIQQLGQSLYGLDYEIATWFNRMRSRDWKAQGWAGLSRTVSDLQLILADVPGSYLYFAKAREISVRMM